VSQDGVPSDATAWIAFRLRPPFWRSWWFLSIVALGLGAVVYAAHRVRVSKALALERARTRIATDLHDDLGTSLARIAILSDAVRDELDRPRGKAAERMEQIGDTARLLVDRASDIVWSIDPRHDDLGSVLARLGRYASDALEAQGVVWSLSTPSEPEEIPLSLDKRGHLFLILKEALANAAKHSGASRVGLALTADNGVLRAEVEDDGRGFATSTPGSSTVARGGNGLENMRSRAEEAGGRVEISSVPGAGTRVTVWIPLG
jgi:signal transduction histidine kinase